MYTLVYKYLLMQHHVNIPGVGNFSMERVPAKFDFINKVFHPPFHKINFLHESEPAEKKFYSFLANEKNVDDVQAIQLYNEFAFTLKNNIKNEHSVELPGVGILQKNEFSEISFFPIPVNHHYLQDVSAFPVVSKDGSEHYITVGDKQLTNTQQMQEYLVNEVEVISDNRWWLFAVILAIAAATAIMLYYYKHGNLI